LTNEEATNGPEIGGGKRGNQSSKPRRQFFPVVSRVFVKPIEYDVDFGAAVECILQTVFGGFSGRENSFATVGSLLIQIVEDVAIGRQELGE
jgi:hypothetical protein